MVGSYGIVRIILGTTVGWSLIGKVLLDILLIFFHQV